MLTARRVIYVLVAVLGVLAVVHAQHYRYYQRSAHFRLTGTVELGGSVYELDPDDQAMTYVILRDGMWEPAETALIRSNLKPGDTFLDVGANFGYYTVLASRIVGPTGRVIAFEPDPRSFAYLERNVARNGCTNVVLEQKALADKPGTLTLYVSDSNRGGHSLIRDGVSEMNHTVDVPALPLDDYLVGKDIKVDLIKIDTEGAEGFILAGMQETLRKHPTARLVLEYTPAKLEACGYPPDKFLGLLKPHGFRYAEIDEFRGTVLPVSEQDVFSHNLLTIRERKLTNLFLSRDQ